MLMRKFLVSCALCALAGLAVTSASAEPKAAAKKPIAAAKAKAPAAALPAEDAAARTARRAEVIASFEGGSVTVGTLEDAIEAQSPFMRQRFLEGEALKTLLDKTIRFELLANEARKRGYDKNDVVSYSVKQNAVQVMIKKEFDEKNPAESIPAADVKKYYDDHIDEFVRPELRRASLVLVATEEEAKALAVDAKAADMRTFREMARNKSLDEDSKLRGGDLRYFDAKGKIFDETAPALEPALAKAAFALKDVGDTSGPVKVERGFAIVKMTGKRDAHEETLKDSEENLRSRLWRDRRQAGIDAMLESLKTELKPEIHPELVDAIKFDSVAPVAKSATLPVGFPQAKPAEPAPAK